MKKLVAWSAVTSTGCFVAAYSMGMANAPYGHMWPFMAVASVVMGIAAFVAASNSPTDKN